MENDKRIDLLEKLFLLTAVIDIVVISNIGFFLVTLLTICIFLGIIMFVIESSVLLYQAIKTTLTINIFTGIGFFGTALCFILMGIILFILLRKLVRLYPEIINRLKNFVTLNDEKIIKIKTNNDIDSRNIKRKKVIFVSMLTVALILVVISLFTRNYNPVIEFIGYNFDFHNIGEIFLRGIGK